MLRKGVGETTPVLRLSTLMAPPCSAMKRKGVLPWGWVTAMGLVRPEATRRVVKLASARGAGTAAAAAAENAKIPREKRVLSERKRGLLPGRSSGAVLDVSGRGAPTWGGI